MRSRGPNRPSVSDPAALTSALGADQEPAAAKGVSSMRIVIVAPGAVGGYFGALLARAGEDVRALARGAHLAAIRERGLRIEGPDGEYTVRLAADGDATRLGPADVVLFAVKLYQAEDAARAAAPLFGPGTVG